MDALPLTVSKQAGPACATGTENAGLGGEYRAPSTPTELAPARSARRCWAWRRWVPTIRSSRSVGWGSRRWVDRRGEHGPGCRVRGAGGLRDAHGVRPGPAGSMPGPASPARRTGPASPRSDGVAPARCTPVIARDWRVHRRPDPVAGCADAACRHRWGLDGAVDRGDRVPGPPFCCWNGWSGWLRLAAR